MDACECVPSCEHCAFIIFNVIPESYSKAYNEAHWVSGQRKSSAAGYLAPSIQIPLSLPRFFSRATWVILPRCTNDVWMIRALPGQDGLE